MDNKDTYFVAVKVFLRNDEGKILLTKDRFGDWDIPGGRLRESDFEVPLEQVVARKIGEELGTSIDYVLEKPVVFMRHERDEILGDGTRAKRRIFAVGYSAEYKGGEIKLGKNHEKSEWISIKDGKPEDYLTGGWLKGMKEYIDLYKNN
jgi:ADP-ribose pyrophosphatase YjhB (NUDIX family)